MRLGLRSGRTFPIPVDGSSVLPRGDAEGSFEQSAEDCGIVVSKFACCLAYGCSCSQLWDRCKNARLLSPCHKAEACLPSKQPSERTTCEIQRTGPVIDICIRFGGCRELKAAACQSIVRREW